MEVVAGVAETRIKISAQFDAESIRIVIVPCAYCPAGISQFSNAAEVIPCVVVTGGTDLFPLRAKPPYHNVIGVTLLSHCRAIPDVLLGAQNHHRG
jgi:hypothetical protein